MNFLDTLLSPFQFVFMVHALVISVLVAVPMALLSSFVVLKGWSLMGDAISHAIFPGVVIAYIVGFPYAVGAFAAGMFCAIATGFLEENSRIKEDTVMGIVFSGMFGLGLVLYVKIQTDVHLDHILFGDMLGVSWGDIAQATVVAAVTAGILGIKWKDFLLHAFDPTQAKAVGLRIGLLHYGLLALISLTIVGALQAVGIILSIAMLIAPGAIAFLLTRKFSTMLVLSIAIAVTGSFTGVYLSFFIDSAPAPTIVLVLSIIFVLAFVHAMRQAARSDAAEPV
ncbi:manganese/iron transport system permease protein [Rhizobium aethiopicum]|uniref:Manganese/iron transport system permease protein n=1 Tax=Rhizobium aethiopicum TaxID=1138170 RepID=A0A7W6QDA0_9HYPH|nr:metal ABC transporter permease [Rhizobium aethiopicum]MBB4195451.1 manganese/iron transport system permease protein [Rhizobium aethiopicum]MBB4583091.1 manganese/iron transport system permease protein [Rhizobium aethiopicum]